MKGSVTVHIEAPADRVWDLVSDVTRIGEFSPETFEAQWLDGASGPRAGARFRGHVRRNGRGPVYWTTCTVVASVPGREFAFAVGGPGAGSGVCVRGGESHGQPGSGRARGDRRVLSAGVGPRPGQEEVADGCLLRQPAEA